MSGLISPSDPGAGRVHLLGVGMLALAIALGVGVAGWLAGWYGPERVALLELLPGANRQGMDTPRPRQGLVLRGDSRGQVLFGRYCDSCHPAGGKARGESLIAPEFRRDFQNEFQIAQLVREGTCLMPKFDRFLLADADLEAVAKFTLSRAKAAGEAKGIAPLPPLDGPGILREKCETCHNESVAPTLDPRDPQISYILEVDMARCAGLTAVQKQTLRDHLLSQQGR